MFVVKRLLRAPAAAAVYCGLLACAVAAQDAHQPPESHWEAWLALLHYSQKDGRWVSDIKEPSFFLDPEGPTDPKREWSANVRAFLAPDDSRGTEPHAQCRFPARFALVKAALSKSDGPTWEASCPEVEAHIQNLGATSLSVVFVSHYLGNPASAFGHVMLYLGRGDERSAVLADYSVSFEADTDGMAPMEYLPRGLFGGLDAGYRLAPLHERVRKYERLEQRDLLLFPLQVSQEEVNQLVRHLWELRNVVYRYGFFGENCAQKILAVVHAVVPEYAVLPYQSAAVLPQEVVRLLVERIGLAGEPIRRPSLLNQYASQLAQLSPEEKEQLEEMTATRSITTGASPAVLSAALVWSELEMPYRAFQRESETEEHPDLLWMRELWVSRARVRGSHEASAGATDQVEPSLLRAHGPTQLKINAGQRNEHGSVLGVGGRWLLHGPLDPYGGYPPLSTVEVARIDLTFSQTGAPIIEEATAIRVEKLGPASALQSPIAWKVEVGARRLPSDGESPLHIGAEVGLGAGVAFVRPSHSVALYSMASLRPGASLATAGTAFLPAAIWSGGLLLRLPGDFRARVTGEYSLSVSATDRRGAGLAAVLRKGLMRDWDLEVAVIRAPGRSGVAVGVVSFN